jgi:hypothetical protein
MAHRASAVFLISVLSSWLSWDSRVGAYGVKRGVGVGTRQGVVELVVGCS